MGENGGLGLGLGLGCCAAGGKTVCAAGERKKGNSNNMQCVFSAVRSALTITPFVHCFRVLILSVCFLFDYGYLVPSKRLRRVCHYCHGHGGAGWGMDVRGGKSIGAYLYATPMDIFVYNSFWWHSCFRNSRSFLNRFINIVFCCCFHFSHAQTRHIPPTESKKNLQYN